MQNYKVIPNWMPCRYYNGKLDKIWQYAKPANFEIIRIGGIDDEENFDAILLIIFDLSNQVIVKQLVISVLRNGVCALMIKSPSDFYIKRVIKN